MKRIFCLILIFILLLTCGCTAGYMDKTNGDSIPPVQDSTVLSGSLVMPLYFRYYNEPMLVRYPLTVDTTTHEQPEFYAISTLLSSPLGKRTGISYLFNGKTKLISVDSDGSYLYVTLSDGFYQDTKGTNDDETRLNRSLALYSIVNTVCEMGNHSYVQLYIEQNGASIRPDSYEMGISKTQATSTPLGPLSRNTAILLTPSTVAKTALGYYSKTEWNKLYLYLGSSKQGLPLLEEMTQKFNYLNLNMTEFSVEENYTVSEDGKLAFVQVSFKIRSANASYEVSNVPLELVYNDRAWLISYESLLKHLGVEA